MEVSTVQELVLQCWTFLYENPHGKAQICSTGKLNIHCYAIAHVQNMNSNVDIKSQFIVNLLVQFMLCVTLYS